MLKKSKKKSIKILPRELINQISAGEIIDRPSSVVKELIENSIDADATQIDIDIEKGGMKLIRICDNGIGIKKQEMILALKRHATNKISNINDLKSLESFGFRGEALSSISSVSRLTLISRTAKQITGWKLYSESKNILKNIKPIAHPIGTTLEVLDLFFNIPVKKKFMKSEKMEYLHIDKIIKFFILSNFHLSIKVYNNKKLVSNYNSIKTKEEKNKRIEKIFGKNFIKNSFEIICKYCDFELLGWIENPQRSDQKKNTQQYFYVNNRIVFSKVVNHAIYQAYRQYTPNTFYPAYILYLKIKTEQIDINVHPKKREIYFYQERIIHDFIYHNIVNQLKKSINKHFKRNNINKINNEETSKTDHFTILLQKEKDKKITEVAKIKNSNEYFGEVLTILHQQYALTKHQQNLLLISLSAAKFQLINMKLNPNIQKITAYTLLIPLRIRANTIPFKINDTFNFLKKIGIHLTIEKTFIIIKKIPLILQNKDLKSLILDLIKYIIKSHPNLMIVIQWISKKIVSQHAHWQFFECVQLLHELKKYSKFISKNITFPFAKRISIDEELNFFKKNY